MTMEERMAKMEQITKVLDGLEDRLKPIEGLDEKLKPLDSIGALLEQVEGIKMPDLTEINKSIDELKKAKPLDTLEKPLDKDLIPPKPMTAEEIQKMVDSGIQSKMLTDAKADFIKANPNFAEKVEGMNFGTVDDFSKFSNMFSSFSTKTQEEIDADITLKATEQAKLIIAQELKDKNKDNGTKMTDEKFDEISKNINRLNGGR